MPSYIDVLDALSSPRTWWADKGIRTYLHECHVHLVRRTRQGYPIGARSLYVSSLSPAVFLSKVEDSAELMLKKPADRRTEGEATVQAKDVAFSGKYPTLWEYLTSSKWEDGTTRMPSSLLFFSSEGLIKVMLRDKDAGLCLWAAGQGFTQALAAIEGSLNDPSAVWRQDRQEAGQKAGRVRKAS